MLPYAPLQLLLFRYDDGIAMPDLLVMTSANESGAPICRDDADARRELGGLCDAMLSHDRLIRVRADDTVMDLFEGRPYMVRRSRGWAPLPFILSEGGAPGVLAVGGELKNAFCLASGEMLYPSAYVGDLGDVRTVEALSETIGRMETLLEIRPQVVACDLHPGYNSTMLARRIADERGLALVPVQHHYAHVAACMAENDCAGPVIGVSFDGTGYGTDGTIWGGEVLLSTYERFERAAHVAAFPQPGGDASAREGWRVATGMLCAERGPGEAKRLAVELGLCDANEAQVIALMVSRGLNTVTSTSVGRLFDAACAVLGIRRASSFEGEAATQLQFAAERCPADERPAQVFAPDERLRDEGGAHVLATDELFWHMVLGRLVDERVERLAYAFHLGLAELVEAACLAVREASGVNAVALTGGCYQNLLLLKLSCERLRSQGFDVLTHSLVPPNDGGIALGQAVVATHRMQASFAWNAELSSPVPCGDHHYVIGD